MGNLNDKYKGKTTKRLIDTENSIIAESNTYNSEQERIFVI